MQGFCARISWVENVNTLKEICAKPAWSLRPSSWEHKADVIQAITPISTKLGQNEGYTAKQPLRQSGLACGFFTRYLAHPHCLGPKIRKTEPKLASKSETPPDHRTQTILSSFSLKEDCNRVPSVAYHSSFESYRLKGANQEFSTPNNVTKDFANMKFWSIPNLHLVKVQAFGNLYLLWLTSILAQTRTRIKFLTSVLLRCRQALKLTWTATMCNREKSANGRMKANNPLQD